MVKQFRFVSNSYAPLGLCLTLISLTQSFTLCWCLKAVGLDLTILNDVMVNDQL